MEVLLFQETKRTSCIKDILDFLCSKSPTVKRNKLHTQLSSLLMFEKLFSNDVFFPVSVSPEGMVMFSKTIPNLKSQELEELFKKSIEKVSNAKKRIGVRMDIKNNKVFLFIGKKPLLPINFNVYLKLCQDLKRNNIPCFHWNKHIAFLVCRYFSTLGGESNQLGITYYDKLQEFEPIKVELFASPINHTVERFCSLYPDTDRVFGSYGSVFDFLQSDKFTEGLYVANPPYHPKTMVMFIKLLLEKMKTVKSSVLITCPVWDYDGFCKLGIPDLCFYKHMKYEMFEMAKSSEYYRFHVIHGRDNHTYLNHRKQNKVAVVGTYTIFLSSKECPYEDKLKRFIEEIK